MPANQPEPKAPRGFRWIFVKQFKHWRTGKIIRAEDHGKKAFRFLVRERTAA